MAAVTFGAWLSPACGGDSESDNNKKTGGTGGTGGTEAGTGGSSTGGTAGTSGGTGGTTAEAGKCVAADCPGLGGIAPGCCLPTNECGYDGSAIGLGCVSQEDITKLLEGGLDAQVPPDAADPNCDGYTVGGVKLQGCCPSTGFCGVFEPFVTKQCYDWGALPAGVPKPDNIVPKPCGDGAAPSDAGSDVSSD